MRELQPSRALASISLDRWSLLAGPESSEGVVEHYLGSIREGQPSTLSSPKFLHLFMSSEQRSVKSVSRHRHPPSHTAPTLAAHLKGLAFTTAIRIQIYKQDTYVSYPSRYGVFLDSRQLVTVTISLVHTFNFDLRIHVKSCDFNLVLCIAGNFVVPVEPRS